MGFPHFSAVSWLTGNTTRSSFVWGKVHDGCVDWCVTINPIWQSWVYIDCVNHEYYWEVWELAHLYQKRFLRETMVFVRFDEHYRLQRTKWKSSRPGRLGGNRRWGLYCCINIYAPHLSNIHDVRFVGKSIGAKFAVDWYVGCHLLRNPWSCTGRNGILGQGCWPKSRQVIRYDGGIKSRDSGSKHADVCKSLFSDKKCRVLVVGAPMSDWSDMFGLGWKAVSVNLPSSFSSVDILDVLDKLWAFLKELLLRLYVSIE